VDLARLAGLYPAGVVCEIMNEDGTMARVPQLRAVARDHGLTMITVADLIAFRLRTETLVRRVEEASVRTRFGDFRIHVFENSLDGEHHLALVKGAIDPESPVLVRVQSQSTLGDVFDAAGHDGGSACAPPSGGSRRPGKAFSSICARKDGVPDCLWRSGRMRQGAGTIQLFRLIPGPTFGSMG